MTDTKGEAPASLEKRAAALEIEERLSATLALYPRVDRTGTALSPDRGGRCCDAAVDSLEDAMVGEEHATPDVPAARNGAEGGGAVERAVHAARPTIERDPQKLF